MGIAIERLTAIGIDAKVTAQRFLGKTEFHVRMLKSFHGQDDYAKLQDALAGGDFKETERIARSVKGSAANLGFPDLAASCVELVKAARAEDACQVQSLGADVLQKIDKAYQGISTLPDW